MIFFIYIYIFFSEAWIKNMAYPEAWTSRTSQMSSTLISPPRLTPTSTELAGKHQLSRYIRVHRFIPICAAHVLLAILQDRTGRQQRHISHVRLTFRDRAADGG